MLEQWSTGITTQQTQLALMAQGSGSPFASMKVVLNQTNVAPTPTSKLADFTPATFDGYAPIAVGSFPTPYIGADGFVHLTWASVQFTMTGSTTPNTIYSWGLTNTAGTIWVAGNAMPAPVQMNAPPDGIIIVPDLIWGQ